MIPRELLDKGRLFAFRNWKGQTLCFGKEVDLRMDKLWHWGEIAGVGDKCKPHPDFDNGDGYWERVR